MYKLYMKSEKGEVKFYFQEGNILKSMSKEDFYKTIEDLKDYMIKDSIDKGNSKEIRFNNGLIIEFDKCPELSKLCDLIEKENIKTLASKYPKGYKPKVNRSKSKAIGKRVASLTLAGAIVLSGLGLTKSLGKSSEKEEDISISNEDVLSSTKSASKLYNAISFNDVTTSEVPENIESQESILELAFEYKPDGKYESTKDYFGDLINNYCEKYGFSGCENLICSQLTQERPLIREDGTCYNPYQLTNFVGVEFSVPIYDENGLTGDVKYFKVTQEMINNTASNIEIGIAYLRYCVNQTSSLLTGMFCYNQGPFSLGLACNYFGLDKNLYMGDENSIAARDLIIKYFKVKAACNYYNISMDSLKDNSKMIDELIIKYQEETSKTSTHGDTYYLENVLGYLPHEDRENPTYSYYLENELKTIEIVNTLEYNNTLGAR